MPKSRPSTMAQYCRRTSSTQFGQSALPVLSEGTIVLEILPMSDKQAPIAGHAGLRTKVGALLVTPAGGIVAKKPATLEYGIEELPPAMVTWISAVQHVGVFAIFMVYPLIIVRQAGLPADQITNILQLGLLVMAAATVLQALPRGPVGSHLLAPSIFTGIYLAPALLARDAGGMPLVWGMTIFAGIVEMALSRVWSRMRPFIPPASAGLVIFRVAAIIGLAAVRLLLEESLRAFTARDSMLRAVPSR